MIYYDILSIVADILGDRDYNKLKKCLTFSSPHGDLTFNVLKYLKLSA